MPPAPLPTNEAERLTQLQSFEILDTVAEQAYDAITYLASEICEVPIALISIVDRDRQWFKSRVGLEATETPRDVAFCAHAINRPTELLVVPDATQDRRFSDNPLVIDDPNIRFYAGAPLVTSSGNALGTLCVIDRRPRMLTEKQEKALTALSTQVMALLELRWTVRELERKQRELEEATRHRDTFMAMVSHEIRTPLTAVLGFANLLRDPGAELSEDDRRGMLDTLASEAGDVEHLIEDLLIAARADAGSLTVASVSVNLPAQVAQVMEGLDPLVADRVRLELEPARVCGDPARIRQIIRNLVTNAVRYGGPNVSIRTKQSETRCHLLVVDDGDGIPEEDRERVFESFSRATNAKDVAGSVGLGLPVSRLLAEKMRGTLTYRYEAGHSVHDLALPALD